MGVMFPGMGRMGGLRNYFPAPYWHKLVATIGASLLRYYPLEDLSGLVAADMSRYAGNGAYDAAHLPTFQASGVASNRKSTVFDANTYLNAYSAALNAAYTPDEMTMGCFFKPPAGWWADNTQRQLFWFRYDASNVRGIYKTTSNTLIATNVSSGTSKTVTSPIYGIYNWLSVIMTSSLSNNRLKFYVDGSLIGDATTGLGTYTIAGKLNSAYAVIGNYNSGTHGFASLCNQSDWFLATRELTPTEISIVANPFPNPVTNLFAIGDSKTANYPNWRISLTDLVKATRKTIASLPYYYAGGGLTTQNVKDNIDGVLTARTETPAYVIINLGANDVNSDPGAVWKTNTDYIIDACHAKWPSTPVYLTKIWRRDTGGQAANIAIINAYIDQLLVDPNHTAWLRLCINEADYLPGGDDGATYTSDGTHPNAAGCALLAAAIKTVLGI